MSKQYHIGDLEQLVLLAVLRIPDNAYAVSIAREIQARTGRPVRRASVYVSLSRLERKGYLKSHMGEPSPKRGGKSKRLFKTTRTGLSVLRRSLKAVRHMERGLAPVLYPTRR